MEEILNVRRRNFLFTNMSNVTFFVQKQACILHFMSWRVRKATEARIWSRINNTYSFLATKRASMPLMTSIFDSSDKLSTFRYSSRSAASDPLKELRYGQYYHKAADFTGSKRRNCKCSITEWKIDSRSPGSGLLREHRPYLFRLHFSPLRKVIWTSGHVKLKHPEYCEIEEDTKNRTHSQFQ